MHEVPKSQAALGDVFKAAMQAGSGTGTKATAAGQGHAASGAASNVSKPEPPAPAEGAATKPKGFLKQVLALKNQQEPGCSTTPPPEPLPAQDSQATGSDPKASCAIHPGASYAGPASGPPLLKAVLKLQHSTPKSQDGTSLAQNSEVLPPALANDSVKPAASKPASSVFLSALAGIKASSGPAPDTSGTPEKAGTETHDAPKSFISPARSKLSITEKLKQTMKARNAARLAKRRKEELLAAETKVPHLSHLCVFGSPACM